MIKKIIITCIVCLCVFSNTKGVYANNSDDIGLTAEFALALDLQQETILYEKNKDEKMFPASMTKIVTVIVALEMIKDLNETVEITKQDLDTIFETNASAAFFTIGEVVTYKDLIYGAILPSGADATRALAFNLCGDLESFVDKMNDLVKKLKLKNTHFVNTTGIHDDNHYTTAADLSEIFKYALQNKDFKDSVSTYAYRTSNGIHDWVNTGMFYPRMYGVDISKIIGCKSGYTEEASNCLISLADVGGREVIMVVGKTDHSVSGGTVIDTNKMIQYCSDNYAMIELFKKGAVIKKVDVLYAKSMDEYELTTNHSIQLYLPINYNKDDIKYVYQVDTLKPDIAKGKEIGSFAIKYKGKQLYQETFKSSVDIKKDYLAYIKYLIMDKFLYYIIAIVLVAIYVALYLFDPKTKTFKKLKR